MILLEIAREIGLNLRRTSSTGGGEHHSCCPDCGGVDRFIVWAGTDRYWCRQCGKAGDPIQFCRDFLGLNYRDACEKVGKMPNRPLAPKEHFKKQFEPQLANIPSKEWQRRALEFALEAHKIALNSPRAKKLLEERGFSPDTIKNSNLGWNEEDRFEELELWGLSEEIGKKKVWLPRGMVIPAFWDNSVMKLKIRRDDIGSESKGPKYVEISGSRKTPAIYGNPDEKPVLLLESELDAILVHQVAGDLCFCVAIGGASKRPDLEADQLLRQVPLILFALDVDEAGIKAYPFWRANYSQLKLWPVPQGKSPGDAFKSGLNIRLWIQCAINKYKGSIYE